MKRWVKRLIWFYQAALSGFLGPRCRFYPSCSNYAMEAIETHGIFYGGVLSFKRICKCHPYHAGGIDEVPRLKEESALVSHQGVSGPHNVRTVPIRASAETQ